MSEATFTSEGAAEGTLDLECDGCGDVICNVEERDDFAIIAQMVADHECNLAAPDAQPSSPGPTHTEQESE